jgi:predicted nucleotidyltransferase
MTVAAHLIAAMTACIVEEFAPLWVIVIGSHARGEAGPDSDVDLLVVPPSVDDKRETAIRIRQALAHFLVSKDVIVTTPEEVARRGDLVGTVLRPALREGRVVCERA